MPSAIAIRMYCVNLLDIVTPLGHVKPEFATFRQRRNTHRFPGGQRPLFTRSVFISLPATGTNTRLRIGMSRWTISEDSIVPIEAERLCHGALWRGLQMETVADYYATFVYVYLTPAIFPGRYRYLYSADLFRLGPSRA